ncbi:tellurite resistance protein TerC [Propionibacterium cyclohexanicum]|uniref:Tellurite resistance protein TerC n=1 Tax=Propionibacterium cyclohexanicum TaxID=64702 RepID=A0A1H9SAV2_9ACTN|nr:TerC family protein [Propionibacterium cyclohexanicum]SER82091.1 tellurite resistance protein TerC [Propionibacterium cyclohexanicum]
MVPPLVWIVTLAVIIGLLAFDYFAHVRKAHSPGLREAAIWSGIYVGLALLFGVLVTIFGGTDMGGEYFAGYITEKALSVDNLFVFLIIMTSFKVPRAAQQKVLLFGIVFSLIARSGFILVGAALINRFSWVFYFFGLVLLLTAGHTIKPEDEEHHGDEADNIMIRLARRVLHTSEHYDEDRLVTTVGTRRMMTPMVLVMAAIGGTDILFALDSIPAIFGLTQSIFIVFTATAFSLMGLRQLFFLIDGLLDRLIYLSYGLAAILGFIGVKLILHALHENTVPFINDGEPVHVVEVSTFFSLAVIVAVLAVTVVASLLSPAGKAQAAITGMRHLTAQYLDLDYESDPEKREQIYEHLVSAIAKVDALAPKYRATLHTETELMASVDLAHSMHAQWRGAGGSGVLDSTGGRS